MDYSPIYWIINMKKIANILIATNSQKVLNFFLDHPGKDFVEREIKKVTKLSKSGINYALKELVSVQAVYRDNKGKINFYSLNYKHPLVKQLKVLKTITYLQPLIRKLKAVSSKIILFGSASRGEDIPESDIDLFIFSNNKKEDIEYEMNKVKLKRKAQLVVRTELGHIELKNNDPVFYEQIQRGIILWEKE